MNICIFKGNFVRDPELRETSNGTSVINFTIAVNRRYKRGTGEVSREAAFIDCEAWDTGAETIASNFKKGDAILINCSAKNEKWVDKEGRKNSRIKFRVNQFDFCSRKKYDDDDVSDDELVD